jgi:hypothetical protein
MFVSFFQTPTYIVHIHEATGQLNVKNGITLSKTKFGHKEVLLKTDFTIIAFGKFSFVNHILFIYTIIKKIS